MNAIGWPKLAQFVFENRYKSVGIVILSLIFLTIIYGIIENLIEKIKRPKTIQQIQG
jgi:hypothetical protein